jgi:hypothetical protein
MASFSAKCVYTQSFSTEFLENFIKRMKLDGNTYSLTLREISNSNLSTFTFVGEGTEKDFRTFAKEWSLRVDNFFIELK